MRIGVSDTCPGIATMDRGRGAPVTYIDSQAKWLDITCQNQSQRRLAFISGFMGFNIYMLCLTLAM